MLKEDYLKRFSIDYQQGDDDEEEIEESVLQGAVRDFVTKALCCLRKSS
jgi:hypothetical protein